MPSNNLEGLGKAIFEFLTCIESAESAYKNLGISRALFFNLKSDQMPERKSTCDRIFQCVFGMEMPEFNNKVEVLEYINKLQHATQQKKEAYEKLCKKTVGETRNIRSYTIEIKSKINKFGEEQSDEQYEDFLISRLYDPKNRVRLESYYSEDDMNPKDKSFYFYFPQWICNNLKFESPIVFDMECNESMDTIDLSGDADITYLLVEILEFITEKGRFREEVLNLIHNDFELDWGDFEEMSITTITPEELIQADEEKRNKKIQNNGNTTKKSYSILCDILDTLEIGGKVEGSKEAKRDYMVARRVMNENGLNDLFDILFKQVYY